MNKNAKTDDFSDKEIERRMQDAIQRALDTPPKPFTKPAKGGSKNKTNKKWKARGS